MNAALQIVLAAFGVVAKVAPAPFNAIATLVITLLGHVDLPAGDPRAEKLAAALAAALDDMKDALDIEDASLREAARLAIENRILRAWVEVSPGRGT